MHLVGPNLQKFDDITFELCPDLSGPRWCLNVDKGYSGVYANGYVRWIDETAVYITYNFDFEKHDTVFPNYGSSDYDPKQWSFPGYLKKKTEIPDCDCGCGEIGYHWRFCQRKKYLDAIS